MKSIRNYWNPILTRIFPVYNVLNANLQTVSEIWNETTTNGTHSSCQITNKFQSKSFALPMTSWLCHFQVFFSTKCLPIRLIWISYFAFELCSMVFIISRRNIVKDTNNSEGAVRMRKSTNLLIPFLPQHLIVHLDVNFLVGRK